MSVSSLIHAIEVAATSGSVAMMDVDNIRRLVITDEHGRKGMAPDIAKQILHIWNVAVRLSQSKTTDDTTRTKVVPQLRLLVVDTLRLHRETNQEKLFYCIVHTFKSFLDVGDFDTADKLFQEGERLFPILPRTSEVVQCVVLMYTWKADQTNDLNLLIRLVSDYHLESSHLISFLYDKAGSLNSVEWCSFALSIVTSSDYLKEDWKEQLTVMMVQLLMNNGRVSEAVTYIDNLTQSSNKEYLSLKIQILEGNPDINLLSFVHSDQKLVTALCLFVAEHADILPEKSAEFVYTVLRMDFPPELKTHVTYACAKVACVTGRTDFANSIIPHIEYQVTEIAGMFWNKAIDLSSKYHSTAFMWMRCARMLINNDDNVTQACCCRFMAQCLIATFDFDGALELAEEAVQRDPSNSHGYLTKFRVLKNMDRLDDASSMITEILSGCPYLESFDTTFFTSVSAELFAVGDLIHSLDYLIAVLDFKSDVEIQNKGTIIVSAFAVLQRLEDHILRYKYISAIARKVGTISHLSEGDCTAITAITYTTGSFFAEQGRYKKAVECFKAGMLFSGNLVNVKCPCVYEAVNCLIETKKFDEARQLLEDIVDIDSAPEKIHDGFILCRIKLSLVSDCDINIIREMVEDIYTPEALAEICDFMSNHVTNYDVIGSVLERAYHMDRTNYEVTASLLHQLVRNVKTKEQLKECYEMIFRSDNIPTMTTDQLQFFMATAWNTGVQLAKARRPKEAEWWFATSLQITQANESLAFQYYQDLDDRFTKFLEHERSRASFQI